MSANQNNSAIPFGSPYRINPYSWESSRTLIEPKTQVHVTVPLPPTQAPPELPADINSVAPWDKSLFTQLVSITRQELMLLQRWGHSYESASCVRLQCAVKKFHPVFYASVIERIFHGRWHIFCASAGLHLFSYNTQDIEGYPSLAEYLPVTELRVSFSPKSIAIRYDAKFGAQFPVFKAKLLEFCASAVQTQVHSKGFGYFVDSLVVEALERFHFARNFSRILLKKLLTIAVRQLNHPPNFSATTSTKTASTYATRVFNFGAQGNDHSGSYQAQSGTTGDEQQQETPAYG